MKYLLNILLIQIMAQTAFSDCHDENQTLDACLSCCSYASRAQLAGEKFPDLQKEMVEVCNAKNSNEKSSINLEKQRDFYHKYKIDSSVVYLLCEETFSKDSAKVAALKKQQFTYPVCVEKCGKRFIKNNE